MQLFYSLSKMDWNNESGSEINKNLAKEKTKAIELIEKC